MADVLYSQMQGLAAVWCMTAGASDRLLPSVERFLRCHLPALLAPYLAKTTNPKEIS